ncbi:hypothetical protein ACFYOC_21600 [Nocardiopsis alba]|nr:MULTISPECIES: hypothetical protein [Nocardiopsis]MEC3891347.1 hypothetical protein [Nocardiopsis sp. LDBS1602]
MTSLIGTPLGERAWREHREQARLLRRSYLRFCAGAGLVSGVSAALSVFLVGAEWLQGEGFPLALPFFVATLVLLGPVWKRRTVATVAPFMSRPRHTLPRWTFTVLFPVVLLLGVFVPWSPAWSIAAGAVCALPLWYGALTEFRRPLPAYPAVWSRA